MVPHGRDKMSAYKAEVLPSWRGFSEDCGKHIQMFIWRRKKPVLTNVLLP